MTDLDKKRAKIVRAALRGIKAHVSHVNVELTCCGETLADCEASEADAIEAALSVDEFVIEVVNVATGFAYFATFTWCNDLHESLVDYSVSLEAALAQCRKVCASLEVA